MKRKVICCDTCRHNNTSVDVKKHCKASDTPVRECLNEGRPPNEYIEVGWYLRLQMYRYSLWQPKVDECSLLSKDEFEI